MTWSRGWVGSGGGQAAWTAVGARPKWGARAAFSRQADTVETAKAAADTNLLANGWRLADPPPGAGCAETRAGLRCELLAAHDGPCRATRHVEQTETWLPAAKPGRRK